MNQASGKGSDRGSKATGRLGEEVACIFLERKGYEIRERNYWKPWGEIDIIAKAPNRTLVFVEVKTMYEAGDQGLKPEDQMSAAKILKFKREGYPGQNL